MLRGVLEKIVRETWVIVLIACAGLGAVAGLFTLVLPQFQGALNELVTTLPFLRTLISAMVGIDLSDGLRSNMLLAIVWSHPIVLSIVWGFAIVFSSRMPAGEIEQGTIDVLLGWPISRRLLYGAEVLYSAAAGALILLCGFVGFEVGVAIAGLQDAPAAPALALTLLNFLASYFVVAGATQCIAALSDRRGKVKGAAVGFVLASYLLNFLAQFWSPGKPFAVLSFVHYYRPAQALLAGEVPWRDTAVLFLVACALWAIGAAAWMRRSVSAI